MCHYSALAGGAPGWNLPTASTLDRLLDATVATGYVPLVDDEPELARTLSASVQQRIAFGERAGQRVRRIGSGLDYEGERPTLSGTRCASVHGFSLPANTDIPAHRRDQLERLIRYTARRAVSLERLAQDAHGDHTFHLKDVQMNTTLKYAHSKENKICTVVSNSFPFHSFEE